jgi:hypothetical protein
MAGVHQRVAARREVMHGPNHRPRRAASADIPCLFTGRMLPRDGARRGIVRAHARGCFPRASGA